MTLEPLGINQSEEAAYRALLGMPQATVAELSGHIGRDARRSLTRLEQLGLVSRLAGRPVRLMAARPDIAIELLVTRRQEELRNVQRSARKLMAEVRSDDQQRPERIIEVITGQDAIATRFEQLLQGTRKELLILDRPPYYIDRRADDILPEFLRTGGIVRGVYAPESLEQPGALKAAYEAARAGEQARVHPHVPMKLAIADRSLALLPRAVDDHVDSAICVHPSVLLTALVQLFESIYQSATRLVPAERDMSAESDGQLLSLLAAGVKDDTIARQLNISPRTVSRHVADLLDDLGARTRFQAGIQVARRGWID